MKKNHPKIYFEITKADKTAVVFDSTLIALGVCLPKKAKAYNYRKLIDASHGGYLIGNNGKCYHSTDKNY